MSCPSTHRNLHPLGIASRRTSVLWFTSHPSAWVRRSVTASTTLACDRTRRWPGYVIFKVIYDFMIFFLWLKRHDCFYLLSQTHLHADTDPDIQADMHTPASPPLPPTTIPHAHIMCRLTVWGWRTRCVLINWSVIYDNDNEDGWNFRQICNIYFLWLIKMRKLRWYVN